MLWTYNTLKIEGNVQKKGVQFGCGEKIVGKIDFSRTEEEKKYMCSFVSIH